jgi:MFS transporter, DHA2 family, methylenomycin A resistance protein
MLKRRDNWILIIACLTILMINLDLTIVNLALPKIAKDLSSTMSTIQWVVNGFSIMAAVFMVFAGKLGDAKGLKKCFLWGVGIFGLSCLFAGFAQNGVELVIFRLIQGFGFALTLPICLAIVAYFFEGDRRTHAMGWVSATIGFSQAIGPTIGGLILQYLNWRWTFFINVPISCLIILVGMSVIKPIPSKKQPLDIFGALLLCTSLVLLIYDLNQLHYWRIDSFAFLSILITSFALLIICLLFERKISSPVIALHLLKMAVFIKLVIVRIALQAPYLLLLFLFGLLMMNILCYSPLVACFIFIAVSAPILVISLFSHRIAKRLSIKYSLVVSGVFNLLAFVGLSLSGVHAPLWVMIIALASLGIATGLNIPLTSVALFNAVDKTNMGAASGLFSTLAYLACAIAVALGGYGISIVSKHAMMHYFSISNMLLSPGQHQQILSFADGTKRLSLLTQYFPAPTAALLKPVIANAFEQGYRLVMIIMSVLALIGIVTSLMLSHNKIDAKP